MSKELLEKIPAEKYWALTAKTLTAFMILRGVKIILPLLGIGEGVIAPVMGAEKYNEINEKIWSDGGKRLIPWIKEMFNVPAKDAIDAAKLLIVAGTLSFGPGVEYKIFEDARERAVIRLTRCPFWDRHKDLGVKPERMACDKAHEVFNKEGLKVINPKLMYKLTKAMPRGDSYCEFVYEFREE